MAETIHTVPLTHLRESPTNPRKSYSQAALQELAQSIKAQGVMQPIVARTLPEDQQDIWVRHEIVFGHRRFRASKLAGLAEVPVILRPLSNEQAAVAQEHENIHRADVSDLEEADALARMQSAHKLSADEIATAISKSRSYVYGRLKLARMAPEVRTAVDRDGLPADIAIELARHTDHTLQRKALKTLVEPGGGWPSVRHAQQRLRGMFDNNTEQAQFNPADATLHASAGPCTTCPKRAGNDPDLHGVLDAGVCTDSACFTAKTRQHITLHLADMAKQGHRVLQGAQAEAFLPHKHSTPAGHVASRSGIWLADGKHASYTTLLQTLRERGDVPPMETLVAVGGGTEVVRFLTDAQAEAIAKAFGVGDDDGDQAGDNGTPTPGHAARAQDRRASADTATWTPAELTTRDRNTWLRVKLTVLARLLHTPRTTDDLRIMLMREFDMADDFGLMAEVMGLDAEHDAAVAAWELDPAQQDQFSHRAWWQARLATLTADQLGALALGIALEGQLGYGGHHLDQARARDAVAIAQRYGVDVVAAAQPECVPDGAQANAATVPVPVPTPSPAPGPKAKPSTKPRHQATQAGSMQLDAFAGLAHQP